MSADLKGAVLRKLGDEPRWAGLRFRRELPLWLTEISAVPAYNPVYQVQDDRVLVFVVAVGKREREQVYLDAGSRLE